MASLKEQSDSIKSYLENEATTQQDMNEKSQELYKLWDDALNYLWGELKNKLPEDEFAKLLDEQRTWVADKEAAVEEAGKEVEGGSMYPLVVNSESAKLTEERVYERGIVTDGPEEGAVYGIGYEAENGELFWFRKRTEISE